MKIKFLLTVFTIITSFTSTFLFSGDLEVVGSQNFNSANTDDIRISDKDVQATSGIPNYYGVLLNSNLTGDNADIINSTIYSPTADAIEINTTSGQFRGVKIIGNTLYGGEDGTSSSAGFSIGIAEGKDMTIVGNIAKVSRQEALHIEDDQENITAGNNVFVRCMEDGARILNRSAADPILLNGNVFVKDSASYHQGNGIMLVYDSNGIINSCVFTANRIVGFGYGLNAPSTTRISFDNNLIEDCTVAIRNLKGRIHGTTFTRDCPTLLEAGNGSMTEKIVSHTTPTTILSFVGNSSYTGATLKGFAYPLNTSTSTGYNTVELFELPDKLNGRVTVQLTTGSYDHVYYSAMVNWNGSSMTTYDIIKNNGGVVAAPSFVLDESTNTLGLRIYSAAGRTLKGDLEFDGVYYQR